MPDWLVSSEYTSLPSRSEALLQIERKRQKCLTSARPAPAPVPCAPDVRQFSAQVDCTFRRAHRLDAEFRACKAQGGAPRTQLVHPDRAKRKAKPANVWTLWPGPRHSAWRAASVHFLDGGFEAVEAAILHPCGGSPGEPAGAEGLELLAPEPRVGDKRARPAQRLYTGLGRYAVQNRSAAPTKGLYFTVHEERGTCHYRPFDEVVFLKRNCRTDRRRRSYVVTEVDGIAAAQTQGTGGAEVGAGATGHRRCFRNGGPGGRPMASGWAEGD